jgi:hypothetical protein
MVLNRPTPKEISKDTENMGFFLLKDERAATMNFGRQM